MTWRADGPQGNESAKIKYELVPYTRGQVLDLGAGPWKAFPHFTSVDNVSEWAGMDWRPDVRSDCTKLVLFADGSCDAVFSSHLLEHIEDAEAALKEWWRVVKVGGYLVLYLPHKDHYPNMGEPGTNPDHCHDFTPEDITAMMRNVGKGWRLLRDEERAEGEEYSFFQVYQKTKKKQTVELPVKPDKSLVMVRYGGIGDHIMVASILPALKKEGWHITYNTNEIGEQVMRHEPLIDELLVQGRDQVPNEELPAYWDNLMGKYDRMINLCESVEAMWLPEPGRSKYFWPLGVRQQWLDENYVEFTHSLAEVPFDGNLQRFVSTDKEKSLAIKERADMGAVSVPLVVWALSGSSHHKASPYSDHVVENLLECHPTINIVFTGDALSQLLEKGWEDHPRVHCRSGKWTIRESLAFAEQADVIVGPETGILNAVAMDASVAKVIMMSHSSDNNLVRDWVNTIALRGDAACSPCHQLHTQGYTPQCPNFEDTGASECMVRMQAQTIFDAVLKSLGKKDRKAA